MASVLTEAYFTDEAAAFKALEAIIWPNGPTCPHCGATNRINRLEGVRSKASKKNPEGVVRHGLWKCYHCKGQFTVRKGTVFESSHLPLHQWFQATYLMCSSKKGVSSNQLHRTLGCTLKTAWFVSHRLREAMRSNTLPPIGGAGKIVEGDETFISRKRGFARKRGFGHKVAVLSLVERGGSVRSMVIQSANRPDIERIMKANIDRETRLMTDSAGYYRRPMPFASHETVNHLEDEYVRGDVHTNTIEGFFSIFKRGMNGVYQHCSPRHVHRYLAEYDFRYNNRIALGVNDNARTETALRGIVGKRLTYRDSSGVGE
jgi:transposase-like protein